MGLSERIGLPVAIGVLRPMIVLPESFAESEADDRLEAALAHEWAHIRNGDLRSLALLRLLNILLFAQPLFWLLRHMIQADQEALADASASALHGDGRVAYAETLIGWARSTRRPQPGALASAAVALWERQSLLRRRVRLLLDFDHPIEPTTSRRWRFVTASVGLVMALLLSTITLRPAAATAQQTKGTPPMKPLANDDSRKPPPTADRFEYAGRVLDPDGKPVAGARLHLAYFGYSGNAPPAVRATSDAEGRFRIAVSQADFVDSSSESPWMSTKIVATADGFGLGWADTVREENRNADPHDLTVRLSHEATPIEGRVVDLEGRPVSGATIRPLEIFEPEQNDLSAWISASTAGLEGSVELEQKYLKRKLFSGASGLPVAITTDADGRFTLAGLGRERLIRLNLSGPTIQTKEVSVVTREVAPFRVTRGRGSLDWGVSLYYGASFTHAAPPTRPVFGVVKDRETGKPLAGVRIESVRTSEFPVHGFNGIATTSDEHGHYRLVGLPRGRGNVVNAIPPKSESYLAAAIEIPDSPGPEPVSLDIGLKHGVVIEGRVTDKATGEGLRAYVAYNAYEDNPHLAEAPGFQDARVWGRYESDPDGSFRVIGLPGRGLIAAMYAGGGKQFLTGMGLPKVITGFDRLPVVPDGMLGHFNLVAEVNPPGDATTFHCDLALDCRGNTDGPRR